MLTEQSPKAQKMFHSDIMPQLLGIMNSDSLIKIKAQATSATINFVRELIHVDENEIGKKNRPQASLTEKYFLKEKNSKKIILTEIFFLSIFQRKNFQ
jgi:hypothetical protein